MTTLCSDVTPQMIKWINSKVKKGLYKSKSELIRELVREKMTLEDYPKIITSQKVLESIWNNKEDEVWKKYL